MKLITITISAQNAGPAQATGVVVRSLIPDDLTVLSSTTASGAYDVQSGLWNIDPLASGATAELTIVARVEERALRNIPVEVISADQFDPDSAPGNDDPSEDDQTELSISAPRILSARLFLSR